MPKLPITRSADGVLEDASTNGDPRRQQPGASVALDGNPPTSAKHPSRTTAPPAQAPPPPQAREPSATPPQIGTKPAPPGSQTSRCAQAAVDAEQTAQTTTVPTRFPSRHRSHPTRPNPSPRPSQHREPQRPALGGQ
jgi:hypothetical protein